MTGSPTDVERAAAAIAARLETAPGGPRRPTAAIVLGSGLGALADRLSDPVRIGYGDIPGFHVPTVPGHRGELLIGGLGGNVVIAQSGRFHMYEGYSADEAALPIRVFSQLGIDTVLLTNAAGGIRRSFVPGTVMVIADHINLTGRSPLVGRVRPTEVRFPDMTVAYDAELRRIAKAAAVTEGIPLEEGVYVGLLGPSYETPTEIRMLERLGADAVGMSTVVEVIAARALGMRCLAVSTITNAGAGVTMAPLSHAEVMAVAGRVGDRVGRLLEGVVRAL